MVSKVPWYQKTNLMIMNSLIQAKRYYDTDFGLLLGNITSSDNRFPKVQQRPNWTVQYSILTSRLRKKAKLLPGSPWKNFYFNLVVGTFP